MDLTKNHRRQDPYTFPDLITLPSEGNSLAVFHSFVNWHFEDLSFLDRLLPFASVATILLADHLTLTHDKG